MRTFYWVSGIGGTWTYIDAACKQHGRIDWFDNIADIGYWWQTAHDNGMSYSLDVAKRSVEQAILRRATETAARVMEQVLQEESAMSSGEESAADAVDTGAEDGLAGQCAEPAPSGVLAGELAASSRVSAPAA
ncbi:hypothetical protein CAL29_05415 [Bordetella genomosp. 10]|uniref:Uncharacterized protein n=1 Tax=Bordetella genomosp. 10 TaxID=1416804 RepID=A0A261SK87_9BORD|nr:hypothetical protein [Bordetella genomosp. 10]OZI37816.1 hypothetical protein CAL29_05415 [Bordetella genomosp. 10]